MSPDRVVVTPTQYAAIEALARHGTLKLAAHELDVSVFALIHRLRKVRRRTGLTTLQVMVRYGQDRIDIQDGFWLLEDAA